MDCEQVLEAVSAALDGELSPAEQAQLEAHLAVCPECRALAEELSALNAALEEYEPAPPQWLAERVMERVAEQDRVVPISAGRRPGWRRWTGLAAALALTVCAGGIGVWLKTDRAGTEGVGGAPVTYSSSSLAGPSGGCDQAGTDDQEPTAYGDANSEAAANGTPWREDRPVPAMAEPSSAPSSKTSAPSDWRDVVGNYNSEEPMAPQESSAAQPAAPEGRPAAGNAASVSEEQALELVFNYLGGYEEYPEAKLRHTDVYGPITPAYSLRTEKTEDEATSEYCLDYVRISSNALYYEIHLYETVTYEEEKEGAVNSTVTCNWFAVDMDGSGDILVEFPEDYDAERETEYISSYQNAVAGN